LIRAFPRAAPLLPEPHPDVESARASAQAHSQKRLLAELFDPKPPQSSE